MNISFCSQTFARWYYKWALSSLMCVALLLGALVYFGRTKGKGGYGDVTSDHPRPVYCLMITGYTPERLPYARASVRNFLEQSYPNKHLVVVNQSADGLVLTEDEHARDNMLEFFVDKRGKTLGELRNISLQFVPPDAVWTTWDDDDWRAPEYLRTMVDAMRERGADFLMFMHRVEYNRTNGHAFRLTLRSGLMTFFARQHPALRYAHMDTSEDRTLKEYARVHLNPRVLDNDPKLYVRLIHEDNTSVYVDKHRARIRDTLKNKDFFENELDDSERRFVDRVAREYYAQIR